MDANSRNALRKYRQELIECLQIEDVLDPLYAKRAITTFDMQKVRNKPMPYQQVSTLVDTIRIRGPKSYQIFLQVLQENGYEFIASALITFKEDSSVRTLTDAEVQTILLDGGVPSRPLGFVNRPKLVMQIREALRSIKGKHGWIVLHGMGGCGKSVLAAEAVRDTRILSEAFTGGVIWCSIGQVDRSKLLIKLQNLFVRLEELHASMWQEDSDDVLPDEAHCTRKPTNIEEARDRLRSLVGHNFPSLLIVLDDVWSSEVVRAFDIQCHMLVTTRDRGVMDVVSDTVSEIPIKPGVEEDVALNILKGITHTSILPAEATAIVRECKGSPITLAMVGSLLKEHPRRWSYYLQSLKNRKFISRVRKPTCYQYETLEEALKMSVNSLDEATREKYYDLAIFEDDVSLPAKVLQVYWGAEIEDVEDLMSELSKKWLIKEEWNESRKEYFYSIHDLLLDFLRETVDNLQVRHGQFLNQYLKACHSDLRRLADDGYIFLYLTYHLNAANRGELIKRHWLDLEFIQVYIGHVGAPMLLHDYTKYEAIFHDERQRWNEFRYFVSTNVHRLAESVYDLVQLALCQPQDSTVYRQACAIASRKKGFYFDWTNRHLVPSSCLQTSKMHSGAALFASFSTDGSMAASCGSDKVVKIWSVHSADELTEITTGSSHAIRCRFSSDDRTLFVVTEDGRFSQYGLLQVDDDFYVTAKSELKVSEDRFAEVQDMTISSDDSFACFVDTKGFLHLVDTAQNKLSHKHRCHETAINCCQFSPKEKDLVLTASNDSIVKLWRVHASTEMAILLVTEYSGHSAEVVSAIFIPNSSSLVASASDYQIHIWNYVSGEMLQCCETKKVETVLNISASSDGKYLAGGISNFTVQVWSLNGKLVAVHQGHAGWVYHVEFDRSSSRIMSSSDDGTIMMWNHSDFDETTIKLKRDFAVRERQGHLLIAASDQNDSFRIVRDSVRDIVYTSVQQKSRIRCCGISPDTSLFAFGCDDGLAQLLRLSPDLDVMAEFQLNLQQESIRWCRFSSTKNYVAFCSADSTVVIWKGDDETMVLQDHTDVVHRCKFFDNDSKLLTASYDATLKVWDVATGVCLYTCQGHTEWVLDCDVSLDEKMLASSSADKLVKVWDARDGRMIYCLSGHRDCVRSCRFAPDSSLLASGDDLGEIRIWRDGSLVRSFAENTAIFSWVTDLSFSQDCRHVVSVSNNIKWWSVDGTQPPRTFPILGSHARFVWHNADFTSFITVDNAGVLYILKQL